MRGDEVKIMLLSGLCGRPALMRVERVPLTVEIWGSYDCEECQLEDYTSEYFLRKRHASGFALCCWLRRRCWESGSRISRGTSRITSDLQSTTRNLTCRDKSQLSHTCGRCVRPHAGMIPCLIMDYKLVIRQGFFWERFLLSVPDQLYTTARLRRYG